ncbi:MAG: PEP-utilizing enzyme, partial [Planctomycetota bacterium]
MDLDSLREQIDAQQAAIFEAHADLLRDPLWIDKTVKGITQDNRNAEYVFWSVTQEIGKRLRALGSASFSERSHDLYDVGRRVLKFLRDLKNPVNDTVPEGSIVVAEELGPSETASLQRDGVQGFCTNSGGPTSHTAIMAKALAIPAVVGLDFITHYVRTGDFLILDGTDGKV